MPLPYEPSAADTVITRRWARAVADALVAGTGGAAGVGADATIVASGDVAHYARPAQAVAELVAELALGRPERQWAWRALGVLTDSDPDPATAPTATVLAVLDRDRTPPCRP